MEFRLLAAAFFVLAELAVLTSSFRSSSIRDHGKAFHNIPRNGRYLTLVQAAQTTDNNFSFINLFAPQKKAEGIMAEEQRRELGSQELLMLPRQYSPNPDVTFPSLNHVSCAILSATPSESVLKTAVDLVMDAHPLLQSFVEGDGEPDGRIDLFKMVRKGNPNPCTFVSKPGKFTSSDVLNIVEIEGNDESYLDESWQRSFHKDLDDGSWCNVEVGPLWKLELHRFKGSSKNRPCAILFSFNHAISDQSAASRLTDQLLSTIAEIERGGKVKNPPQKQEIPYSVEESVLGAGQRWSDVQIGGVSPATIQYVLGKAAEDAKGPVILPDGFSRGGGIVGALTLISGKAAGGEDERSLERKSTLQFRTLSKASTLALIEKCRENRVTVTNALSAALTVTSSDFIDSGKRVEKERSYKILQSLDMRRFGQQLDKGETVGCLAGSMDLMHGPLQDRTGELLRRNPTSKRISDFWKLAKEGKSQTETFIDLEGPKHAVRVFDFAMTVADLNNLVHLTAQSKDSQGRAYSAGFTNAGVYEKLGAFRKEGDQQRQAIQVC